MAEFEFDGFDELISQLDNLDDRVNRGINKVLQESAEPLKENIESNTARHHYSNDKYGHGHAQDDVVIGRIRSEGGSRDNNYVQVGYERTAWRMWFVEFGTVYQKPQHGVSKSIPQSADAVRKKQIQGLKELIHGQ